MAKSKQSEDSILKLGKKLISELELDDTSNTFARWMAHYIAELMASIKASKSDTEKAKLKKECCNLIIELWQMKDRLPFEKPLDNAHGFLKILRVLKKADNAASLKPRWSQYRSVERESPWSDFLEKVKGNSEKIFCHAIELNLNQELILKDNEWLTNHKEFLSEEKIELIEHLDMLAKIDFSTGVVNFNDRASEKDVNPEERLKVVFDEMENSL
tara:strand:+ start:953 stop:1597 length:645 start_codon:yes stop_codon:yes gene_type:complete